MTRPVNPYVAGTPLRGEQGFFGRQDILDWVTRELRNPNTNALVLFGQRRIGKTSLLLQLKRAMPADAFLPVYFDLQDQAICPLGQVLAVLADTIAEQAGMEPPIPATSDDEGRFFRYTFLPQLYRVLGEACRPVLLLDEFDVLDQVAETELPQMAAARALFPFLRRVMTEDLRLAFVFVVGRRAEDLALDFITTFKVSLVREIWVLDWESAQALVRQAETNDTLHFTNDAVEHILSLTCGHPYLTQLLCQRIWERAYARSLTVLPHIDVSEVEAAIPDALEAGDQALVWLWNGLSPAEKIYAAALAQITDEEKTIPEDRVIQVLTTHAARLRRWEVELAPLDLVKRRVLEQVKGREYRFAVELFCRWVRRNKRLEEVKDELDRIQPFADRLYEIGKDYFSQGQWKRAIYHFRDALEKNADHFRARLQLGEALLALGQTDEAVDELERAYEQDQSEALYALARALVTQARAREEAGDEDDALATCERALQVSPNERAAQETRISIWARRGDAALDQGDLERALAAYREAGDPRKIAQVEALRQSRLQSLYGQAMDHLHERQWTQAIRNLELIVREAPAYMDAADKLKEAQAQQVPPAELYARGLDCLHRGSWEEAVAVFIELVQIDPGYEDAWLKLEEATGKARKFEDLERLYRVSRFYLENEQWESACIYLKRIVESGEQYKDAAALLKGAEKQWNLQTLYTNAEVLLKEEKWEESIAILEEIVGIDRTYQDSSDKLKQARAQQELQSLYKQALDHRRREEWSSALKNFRAVLQKAPNYLDAADKLREAQKQHDLAALYSAGVGFQEFGRWEEAIDRFGEIIRQVGVYKDAATRLAQVQSQQDLARRFEQGENYFRQRKWKEAEGEFEQVSNMDPGYPGVQVRLGEARKQRHLEELRTQGEASLRNEDWQKAVETLEELCTLNPEDGSVTTKLEKARRQVELAESYREGMEYIRRRRWRKAKNALEKVVNLDAHYRDAADQLEMVRKHSARINLHNPLVQWVIGTLIAIIAVVLSLIQILSPPIPTPTPKPATLCNGDFEKRNFECWQHDGELSQSVKCDGGQCYAVLGSSDYKCEGGVPVGEAWIKQSFQVPETVSPTFSLRYRVFSYDLDDQDFFQVNINGKILGPFGNTEWGEASCDLEAWDSGWQPAEFDLGPYRGRMVEVSLHNVNGAIRNVDGTKWWNTWTYVDDVEIR